MKYLPEISYPDHEKSKLVLLERLFREWYQHFAANGSKCMADNMVFDGFYPHYFNQKKRILFIGWEPVDLPGSHYVDILYQCYRNTKCIGDRHLNQSQFHCLMMYVSYGILNQMPTWQAIPCASEIGDTFGGPDGLSFAFMNISKLSNEIWRADHDSINSAHALSTKPRNFIQEEIAVLEPQIIITMCRTKSDKIASLGQLTAIQTSAHAESFWLVTGAHRSLLINTWHFSAHKPNIDSFYTPICDAIRHSEEAAIMEPAAALKFDVQERLLTNQKSAP